MSYKTLQFTDERGNNLQGMCIECTETHVKVLLPMGLYTLPIESVVVVQPVIKTIVLQKAVC